MSGEVRELKEHVRWLEGQLDGLDAVSKLDKRMTELGRNVSELRMLFEKLNGAVLRLTERLEDISGTPRKSAEDMTYRGAVVKIDDDSFDTFTLSIELMNDRSISLSYPKPTSSDSYGTYVYLNKGCNGGEFREDEISYDQFEDWAKIAIGAMPPERERRWLCQICNDKEGFGPMLPDEVWNAITPNPHRVLMCLDCMRARVAAATSLPVEERERLSNCFEAYSRIAQANGD
jgi:hypothetical protein